LNKLKSDMIAENKEMIGWDKIKQIIVTHEEVEKMNLPEHELCLQVLARNIGIKKATGDYIVSTNIDIIVPSREVLNEIKIYKNTFYILQRFEINKDEIFKFFKTKTLNDYPFISNNEDLYLAFESIFSKSDNITLGNFIYTYNLSDDLYKLKNEVLINEDEIIFESINSENYAKNLFKKNMRKYLQISNSGDFQLAHRNIWFDVKGFEESMIGSYNSDINLQLKVIKSGYNILVLNNPGVIHITHNDRFANIIKSNHNKKNNFYTYVITFDKTTNDWSNNTY